MEEYIDIVDERGEKTGEKLLYDEVHKRGLHHRTVHVWFTNSRGQLLLQKRVKTKRAYPGHWDISVAGHISSGETSVEAAQKETREEIGLDLPEEDFKLIFINRQPRIEHKEDFIDDEFNDVYLVKKDLDIANLDIEKEELDEVRWLGLDEFKEWIAGRGEPIVPHKGEYAKLLEYLKSE